MADTKLVICEKCLGTGHVNGGNENSAWSKTCEDCHGIGFSRAPMTNVDRIRSMSDEELAIFLERTQADVAFNKKSKYAFEWGKWLKQPAEE